MPPFVRSKVQKYRVGIKYGTIINKVFHHYVSPKFIGFNFCFPAYLASKRNPESIYLNSSSFSNSWLSFSAKILFVHQPLTNVMTILQTISVLQTTHLERSLVMQCRGSPHSPQPLPSPPGTQLGVKGDRECLVCVKEQTRVRTFPVCNPHSTQW